MKAKPEDWALVEKYITMEVPRCILELRARVEALEQRATTEESSATEPAPAADRPLWEQMAEAAWSKPQSHYASHHYAAEIDAVAEWLAAGHPTFAAAANALRAEARCTREGRRG